METQKLVDKAQELLPQLNGLTLIEAKFVVQTLLSELDKNAIVKVD